MAGRAGCTHDYRSDKKSGILIADFDADVAGNLSSSMVASIKSKLIGACLDENEDQVQEVIRSLFQNEGYVRVEVENTALKTLDPLVLPKPVAVVTQITPGQIYRFGEIKLLGNRAISSSRLLKDLSLRKGDVFRRDKVAGSFDSIRKAYAPLGFVDLYFVPDTEFMSDATVNLTITITEGPQYRMGKLKIFARKVVAERLAASWHLSEGSIFDFHYPDSYITSNKDLLPPDFIRAQLRVVRNCPEGIVEVRLILDQTDPALASLPQDVNCTE